MVRIFKNAEGLTKKIKNEKPKGKLPPTEEVFFHLYLRSIVQAGI